MASKIDATDLIHPANGDPVEQICTLLGGKPSHGVHHAIECLGLKQTAEQAFRMLRNGGTATIVGMIPFGMKIELHGFDFLREKRIQGSSTGSNRFSTNMPRLMEFYRRGKLHLDDLVSAHIKLDQINEGFASTKAGRVVRSVIDSGVV